jgi:hypothetical protein
LRGRRDYDKDYEREEEEEKEEITGGDQDKDYD